MHQQLIPIFLLEGLAEEALKFYGSLFSDTQIEYHSGNASRQGRISSMPSQTILRFNSDRFYRSYYTPIKDKVALSSQAIYVECTSELEIDTTYNSLLLGGEVVQPLSATRYGCKFGSLIDRFGTSWQLNLPHFKTESENLCMANTKEVRAVYRVQNKVI